MHSEWKGFFDRLISRLLGVVAFSGSRWQEAQVATSWPELAVRPLVV
jgi:hypothetical protein